MYEAAVRRAMIGVSSWDEQAAWRTVFSATRATWRAAYLRSSDLGAHRLSVMLLEHEDEPPPERMVLLC
jgi:hypothetical protein